jgi:hypothetical protein
VVSEAPSLYKPCSRARCCRDEGETACAITLPLEGAVPYLSKRAEEDSSCQGVPWPRLCSGRHSRVGAARCRKVAHCCEFFDVRTAWHGPNNVDPVGHCYNLHLDLVTPNFGIQEETFFDEKTGEVFPGTPEIRKGYMYANDQPGFGIDIDEKAAAKYPYKTDFEGRGNDRLLDGTIVRP